MILYDVCDAHNIHEEEKELTVRGRIKKYFPAAIQQRASILFDHIIPQMLPDLYYQRRPRCVSPRSCAPSPIRWWNRVLMWSFIAARPTMALWSSIVFPQLGVAIIDGTAPHVLDPRLPGAGRNWYFGNYWDEIRSAPIKKN